MTMHWRCGNIDSVHNRRGRPTLRVLREDLTSQWDNPAAQRALNEDRLDDLHPLSELPHPIIRKAAESFGENPDDDNYVMRIKGLSEPTLLEIKNAQWRGGVWLDPEHDVCWLVVAGLAKGEHEDYDDFYQTIKRENEFGDPRRWLPDEEDLRLLKRETAAHLRTEWELNIQAQILAVIQRIGTGGAERIDITHPIPKQGHFSTIEITYSPASGTFAEDDSIDEDPVGDDPTIACEEIVVEFFPEDRWVGGNLYWQLVLRVLTSLAPPHQGWDRYKETYSNIFDPGYLSQRMTELSSLVEEVVLAAMETGTHSHYAHREHIAGHSINGKALRSMCGVYFVPTQDHGSLPTCPQCHELYSALPAK